MPSFSPSGFYNVTIVATGNSDQKNDVKVMCVHAWMDLDWGLYPKIKEEKNNWLCLL